MNLLGYFSLCIVAFASPIGKLLIKKSTEYSKNSSQQHVLNIIGLLFVVIFGPTASIGAYYLADNALVAPVAASGVLVNIILAKVFLEEGKNMDRMTVLGIIIFVTGLVSVLWTYSSFVGNEVNDEMIDWGVVVFYFGAWLLLLTISTHITNWFNNSYKIQLFGWSVTCALLNSADIISSMDKWIYNNDRNDSEEITKGLVATVFMFLSNITSYYVLNEILTDCSNPMHIVAAIITCVTLFMDAMGDCFVFQRYKLWESNNYVMAIAGLILMIIGIVVLQTSSHVTIKITNENDSGEESEELLEGTVLSIDAKNKQNANLLPPPSLVPYARTWPKKNIILQT